MFTFFHTVAVVAVPSTDAPTMALWLYHFQDQIDVLFAGHRICYFVWFMLSSKESCTV
jgi:hypothetical protein